MATSHVLSAFVSLALTGHYQIMTLCVLDRRSTAVPCHSKLRQSLMPILYTIIFTILGEIIIHLSSNMNEYNYSVGPYGLFSLYEVYKYDKLNFKDNVHLV